MSTILDTVNPVVVATPYVVQQSTFAINPSPDWLEVDNDSPFQLNIYQVGNLNTPIMTLTPFETNGYPINQLLPIQVGLKLIQVNLVIIASHYYSDPSTEANSPTNLFIVKQLSNSEAQTNHYPVYSSRMNTTVATIANNVNNVGNPPFTSIVYGLPTGDSTPLGAINIENSGFIQQGDSINQGQTSYSGPSGNSTVITNDSIQTPQVSTGEAFFTLGSISRLALIGNTTVANAGTSIAHGLGVIPDMVLCIRDLGSASSDVIVVNFSTMTTTHFTAYSSNAGGSVNCRFFLIKF